MATSILDATLHTPQVLVAQFLAGTETTQYTVAALKWLKLTNATICNTSGSDVVVSISLVKAGGSAALSNRIVSGYSLIAGDSAVVDELKDHVLGPGDFISTVAGTASTVSFVLSGVLSS